MRRIAKELTWVAVSALVCALVLRFSLANALASRMGPRLPRAALPVVVAIEPSARPAAAAWTSGPVANPTPRAPSRVRRSATPARGTAASSATNAWTELRPRLSKRSDGTLRADLRGVSDISEFARGMRVRAAPDGGFEVQSLDRQGYLAAAGVRVGDRLVAVNGRSARTLDELLTAYALGRFGSTVSLQFARGQGHYVINAEVLRGESSTP